MSSDSNAEVVQARHRIISQWRWEIELSLTSIWAASLARRIHHVFRHSSSPPYLLLHCQSPEWLRHARVLSGRALFCQDGLNAGATRTRGERGKVMRWAGKWVEAIGASVSLLNVTRDSGLTRELTSAILAIFHHGKWHGEKVLEI